MTLRKDRFDASEQDFYEALYTQSQAQFGEYITAGTVLNNYAHVFELLIRLRQARTILSTVASEQNWLLAAAASSRYNAQALAGGIYSLFVYTQDPRRSGCWLWQLQTPPLLSYPTLPYVRCWQAVDHPYLVVHSTTGANGGVGAGSEADAVKALGAGGGDRGVCAICHDPVEVWTGIRVLVMPRLNQL